MMSNNAPGVKMFGECRREKTIPLGIIRLRIYIFISEIAEKCRFKTLEE
jgi:hypothetical protein